MTGVMLSGDTTGSISSILELATELFSWLLTNMGLLVTWILEHPLILIGFVLMLCGAVVGFAMRIWRSA